ncbi:MAG: hypothetical protein U0T84_05720 [Chitinophagales bacterium]
MTKTMMILAAFIGLLGITSCNKEDVDVTVKIYDLNFTDPGTTNNGWWENTSKVNGADIKSLFETNKITQSDLSRVKKVITDNVTISLSSGLLDDYKWAEVFIRSAPGSADSVKLAYATIDPTKGTLKMENQFEDAKKYIDFNDFYITTRLFRKDGASTSPKPVTGSVTFKVTIAGK